MFTESSSDDDFFLLNYTTMGDKIVNTILVKHKVTLENKTIHTPPLHSKLGWFLFSTQVAATAVQHCKQGMG